VAALSACTTPDPGHGWKKKLSIKWSMQKTWNERRRYNCLEQIMDATCPLDDKSIHQVGGTGK
jgi:hypothetical protein